MIVAKVILYGICIMFMLFTIFVVSSMIYRISLNLFTEPYFCNARVLDKHEEFKVMPSRSIGVFVIVYAIKVQLTDFKVKKFKVTSDQYLELIVDKEYRFYINNNEVKEYVDLNVDKNSNGGITWN